MAGQFAGDVRHPNQYGPLPISGSSGDSGSPMFIYDKTAGKWLDKRRIA